MNFGGEIFFERGFEFLERHGVEKVADVRHEPDFGFAGKIFGVDVVKNREVAGGCEVAVVQQNVGAVGNLSGIVRRDEKFKAFDIFRQGLSVFPVGEIFFSQQRIGNRRREIFYGGVEFRAEDFRESLKTAGKKFREAKFGKPNRHADFVFGGFFVEVRGKAAVGVLVAEIVESVEFVGENFLQRKAVDIVRQAFKKFSGGGFLSDSSFGFGFHEIARSTFV